MRLAILVLFATLALGAGPDRKEIKKLVDEYLAGATSERQTEIASRLRQGKAKLLTSPLKKALLKDEKRASALNLVTATQAPGLFKVLTRYVDTALEEDVLRAMLAVEDSGSDRFVCERWKRAEDGSDRREILDRLLQECPVTPKDVAFFRPFLSQSGPRADAARAILKSQLFLEDEQLAGLDREWGSIFGHFVLANEPFKLGGAELLRERRTSWIAGYGDASEARLCRWTRGRVRLAPGGILRLPELGLTRLKLTVKVLVVGSPGASVGVQCQGNLFVGTNLMNGNWMGHYEDREPGTTPWADGAWTTVEIEISGPTGSVRVNGTPVGETAKATVCEEINLRCGSTGEMWVGAVRLATR